MRSSIRWVVLDVLEHMLSRDRCARTYAGSFSMQSSTCWVLLDALEQKWSLARGARPLSSSPQRDEDDENINKLFLSGLTPMPFDFGTGANLRKLNERLGARGDEAPMSEELQEHFLKLSRQSAEVAMSSDTAIDWNGVKKLLSDSDDVLFAVHADAQDDRMAAEVKLWSEQSTVWAYLEEIIKADKYQPVNVERCVYSYVLPLWPVG